MLSNFEIAVIVLLLVNIGLSVYVSTRKKSEYYDPKKAEEAKAAAKKQFTR